MLQVGLFRLQLLVEGTLTSPSWLWQALPFCPTPIPPAFLKNHWITFLKIAVVTEV